MPCIRHWQWVCSQNGIDGSIPSLAVSLSNTLNSVAWTLF
nr:MAG TPA: protein of unknown function (DUF2239) [Caudoviricetes sp.]